MSTNDNASEAERQRQAVYLAARGTGEVRGDYMATLVEVAARGAIAHWMAAKDRAIYRGWQSFLQQTNPRPSADQIVFLRTLSDAVRSHRTIITSALSFVGRPAFRAHWAGGDFPPPPEDSTDADRFFDWLTAVIRRFPEAPASMPMQEPQPPPRVIAASAQDAAAALAADDDERGDEDDEEEEAAVAASSSSRDVIDLSSHDDEEEDDVQILSSTLPPPPMTNFGVPAPALSSLPPHPSSQQQQQ